ncbi:MAG: response regulator [Lachnospiraceae bacterium]|nr:response regulator [Lachnospiraceae bacterium]
MKDKTKERIMSKFIKKVPSVLWWSLALCIAFLCMGRLLLPSEQEDMLENCREFDADWYQIQADGEKKPVEVPGQIEGKKGEFLKISTILPMETENGEYLCFRTRWQDVNIYVDGKIRVQYDTEASRFFGTNSPFRYLFVKLNKEDAGKELTYEFVSDSKYTGRMQTVYIGEQASIWFHIIQDAMPKTVVAFCLLLLSLFCIIVCAVMKLIYKRTLELTYLAWSIFLCALWMLSETEFRQLLSSHISVFSNITYWSLMLIPMPLVLYMNGIQKNRYKTIYGFPLLYAIASFVLGTVLQVFDVVQFTQQLPFIHIGMIFTLISIVGTIVFDLFKKKRKEYGVVGIGVLGLLFSAIVEIGLYYVQIPISLGTVLAIGLLFLLITAIVKAGQDLLTTEKNEQQAISAKVAEERFLANMSHEIRTPMNAIVGMTEIMLRGNLTDEQREYLNHIKSSGNALVTIINDILDISKIEAGKMELVDEVYAIRPMLEDIEIIVKNRIGDKPVQFLCEIDESVPELLYGDGLRIRQIIINLANNAVKFTESGQVRIALRAETMEDGRICVFVSVSDTGQGIKKEDLAKLFGAFTQVDSLKNKGKEGTGLGLTISRHFVEMMGGKLEVKSEYGKGSEFFFTIYQQPVSEEMACKLKAKEDITDFTASEAKVLVVDDNELNQKVALGLLEPLQMQIDIAGNGKIALSMIQAKKYDLVFMDHMMPVMDGVEATRRLRKMEGEYYRKLPVIALTANAMKEAQQLFFDAGMNGFVSKPIQMNEICRVIREWLPKELLESGEASLKSADANNAETALDGLVIQGIDVTEGLKNAGNEKMLFRLLGDYCDLIDTKSQSIEQYLKEGRIREFTIEVHALKSTSRLIGALELSDEFRHLETLGNANSVEEIEKETPGVLAHYLEYKKWLSSFSLMKEREKKEVSKEEVIMYLQGIKDSMEAFDLDTADAAMEKLEECKLPEQCIPLMKSLRPLFADVAMEEIIAVADKMIALLEE